MLDLFFNYNVSMRLILFDYSAVISGDKKTQILGPFIREKIRRVLDKTRLK